MRIATWNVNSIKQRTENLLAWLAERQPEPCSVAALFVNTRRDQPNGLAAALGCELTAAGTIVTDADGRTSVAGVFAAGDAATAHSRSVANAIGTGSRVAYTVALDRVAPVVAAAA